MGGRCPGCTVDVACKTAADSIAAAGFVGVAQVRAEGMVPAGRLVPGVAGLASVG